MRHKIQTKHAKEVTTMKRHKSERKTRINPADISNDYGIIHICLNK